MINQAIKKKLNAFVKLSGSLIGNSNVLKWLKNLTKRYYVVICIGSGKQTNQAFEKMGFKIRYCPVGRVCKTSEEKQLAEYESKRNQRIIRRFLAKKGIKAKVIIPFDKVAGILCPVNTDIELLRAYLGFDLLYALTAKNKVKKKQKWLKDVAKVFQPIGKGKLDKIKVVGF